MSVANEMNVKCTCICEFVNPIDAFVQIEIELTCKTANCAFRLRHLPRHMPHATHTHTPIHTIEPRLSTFACVLLPRCFMQQPNLPLFANASSFSPIHLPWQQNLIVFSLFLLLPLLASLQSSYEMLRTKRWLSSLAKWSDWHTDRTTDRQAERRTDRQSVRYSYVRVKST